jgi:polysaccharide export outer membrane protein
MRLPSFYLFLLALLASALPAQVFPTIDPNAAPPAATKTATPPDPAQQKEDKSDPFAAPAGPADRAFHLEAATPDNAGDVYVLGPQDSLNVRVVDMEEMGEDAYPIDLGGYITLPRIGRVHAGGLNVEQLQIELTKRLREYLQDPIVSVTVAEFHSQPVSIMGAVETPGVHQIRGNKTLFEVISEAGGLRDDAGNKITVTRQMANGALPLPNAITDPSGRYSIAELNIRSVMSAKNPQDNIPVKPYDVITVPKADLIYVIGAVKRPGGFELKERANMTVLEALSLAQGLDRAASSRKAKILRTDDVTRARTELPVDVKSILDGKGTDQPLLANDILFIPSSSAKLASYRALEALVQTGSGIAIYRP